MESTVSYSITEAAEALKLSPKTIRRYIKSGKLPSVKVPSKFGEEYRITQIPDVMRKEAEAQAEAQSKVEIVDQEDENKLDAQQLYQENIRLAAQFGAASERIRQLEEQIKTMQVKLLESPKPEDSPKPERKPLWKRLLRIKS